MNVDYFRRYCMKCFGMSIYPDTNHTNSIYGNIRIANSTNKIYFTNGLEDPFQWATVRNIDGNSGIKALFIKCNDCSHCVYLNNPSISDPQALKDARQSLLSTFSEWLLPS